MSYAGALHPHRLMRGRTIVSWIEDPQTPSGVLHRTPDAGGWFVEHSTDDSGHLPSRWRVPPYLIPRRCDVLAQAGIELVVEVDGDRPIAPLWACVMLDALAKTHHWVHVIMREAARDHELRASVMSVWRLGGTPALDTFLAPKLAAIQALAALERGRKRS